MDFLNKNLWTTPTITRSSEITPLFVERYDGPRIRPILGHHDYWEFTFVFKGRGELRLPTPTPLRANDLWLIKPGLQHAEFAPQNLDTLWLAVKGNLLNNLTNQEHYRITADKELKNLLEKLWLRAQRPYGPIGAQLDGLTHAILGCFLRLLNENDLGSDQIDNIVQYITRNFAQNFSCAQLAHRAGYSEGYFYRTFRKRTGKTPIEFLTQIRINYAQRWLKHTTWPIEKIANEVGYDDPLYFSRVFRKSTNLSPQAYRKQ